MSTLRGIRKDIYDPTAPLEVCYFDTPGNAFDVMASGNRAYVADGDGGLINFRILTGNEMNTYIPVVQR